MERLVNIAGLVDEVVGRFGVIPKMLGLLKGTTNEAEKMSENEEQGSPEDGQDAIVLPIPKATA